MSLCHLWKIRANSNAHLNLSRLTSVVPARNRVEVLLTCCVPYFKINSSIDRSFIDSFSKEIDTQSALVIVCKTVLSIAMNETCFANTPITYDYDLHSFSEMLHVSFLPELRAL